MATHTLKASAKKLKSIHRSDQTTQITDLTPGKCDPARRLTVEEIEQLLTRYRDEEDTNALECLFAHFRGVVEAIVFRTGCAYLDNNTGLDEDAFQDARAAFMAACQNYNLSRDGGGAAFSAYAITCLRAELATFKREYNNLIRYKTNAARYAWKAAQTVAHQSPQSMDEDNWSNEARKVKPQTYKNQRIDEVGRIFCRKALGDISVDDPAYINDIDTLINQGSLIADADNFIAKSEGQVVTNHETAELKNLIDQAFKSALTDKEQLVMSERFFPKPTMQVKAGEKGKKYNEIGEMIRVSPERARQIKDRAVMKLRLHFEAQGVHSGADLSSLF